MHIIVEGMVQGVGYRWFAARRAQALGIRGFVRNLYDGTVEVHAAGERETLEELIGELRAGPRSAVVTNLTVTWDSPPGTPATHFEIR